MTYYLYKRGGWQIAVDAVSHQDAKAYISVHAQGAVYQGIYTPGNLMTCTITGAVTTRRQEQISERCRREDASS